MGVRLVRPTAAYAEQVMAYRGAMLANHDSFDGCAGLEDCDSYEEWADFENRLKKRYGEGYVPSDVYLAVRAEDDRLVGIIDYRRELSPFLRQYGGNIGYSVHPAERNKGYAGEMLRLLLAICKERGVRRLLVTCGQSNEPSRRVIVKNGGVLENEAAGGRGVIQRYWIDL